MNNLYVECLKTFLFQSPINNLLKNTVVFSEKEADVHM